MTAARRVFEQLKQLQTEQQNPATESIDRVNTEEMIRLLHTQDQMVTDAVQPVLPQIVAAVELIESKFKQNGRLFYIGAGTSGRLGVLDASECPPTFGTDPEMVQGIIAGGPEALIRAKEGAEDDAAQGWNDLQNAGVTAQDVVCGIMASGRTPYVIGALNGARKAGIATIVVACNHPDRVNVETDVKIAVQTGPEAIMGSTRMKAGTAQKMILNMLTTGSMIKLGKTFGNIMVDLKQNSEKLVERSKRILMMTCDIDYDTSVKLLSAADGNVKTAIVMYHLKLNAAEARAQLEASDGRISRVIPREDPS